ncbi:MAG TPA: hypothetical protein VF897_13610 [Roseiflexaceae bacterium]
MPERWRIGARGPPPGRIRPDALFAIDVPIVIDLHHTMENTNIMKGTSKSAALTFENPFVAAAFRVSMILAIVAVSMVLTPHFSLAAPILDPGNPFADSGAQSTAVEVLKSMRFWVWISAGIGFCIYLVAYFAQGIVPSFFQQFRDYLRNGAILMAFFGVVIQFIISQAQTAN